MRRILAACLFVLAAVLPLATARQPQPEPQGQVEIVYTPDSSVQFALADLAGIPEDAQPHIRYLALYHVPRQERQPLAQTVSFVVNSLSTRKKIQIPFFAAGGDMTVIRINLRDYDIDPKDWDDVARKGSGPTPQPEPYFHAFAEQVVPGQEAEREVKKTRKVQKTRKVWRYDQRYGGQIQVEEAYEAEEEYTVKEKVPGQPSKGKVLKDAPWLNPAAVARLKELTRSEFPVSRADWWVANAIIPPAYYRLLRLGDKDGDFEKLVGADEKVAARVRGQDKGVVLQSTVARHNRTLTRSFAGTGGYYWVSHDSLSSVDERQYAINLLNEKFDATEVIASLPNKLQAYFLTDGQGKRLDFANPDIAVDNTAVDRIVRNGRSCMVCHVDGIRPIHDEVRKITEMLRDADRVRLLVPDYKDYERISDLFSSNLDEQVILDQNLYGRAVGLATGLTPAKNAAQLSRFYDLYVETLLTKEAAASECGLTLDEFDRLVKLSNDNVVLGLTRQPIRPVRRDQWERSYQEFMLLVLTAKQKVDPPRPQAQPNRGNFGGVQPFQPLQQPGKEPDRGPPAAPVREEEKKEAPKGPLVRDTLVSVGAGQPDDPRTQAYVTIDEESRRKIEAVLRSPPPAKAEPPKEAVRPPPDPQLPKGMVQGSKFTVRVPSDDAVVAVDGKEIAGSGPTRSFVTPALRPGQVYAYRFECRWPGGTSAREVTFRAGENPEVDMTRK
jgi:uncharacterized protein (TIGR03000 family)